MSYFAAVANQQAENISKYLEGVVGVVEATSNEAFCLWDKYTTGGRQMSQYGGGYGITVGYCKDLKDTKLPIAISIFKYTVEGKDILFYHPTSRMVDYEVIENWLKENMPASAKRENGTVKTTDCTNFHLVKGF